MPLNAPLKRLLRLTTVLSLGAYVLVNGLACSDDDPKDTNPGTAGSGGTSVNVEDLVYEGEVTDEAAESMLGVTASVDDAKAPPPTAPAEGAALPAATPATFTWNASTAHRSPLPSWLGPERSALAHGDPFTGVAYVLTFSTASNKQLLRVATDKTTYTPDATAWGTLKGAGAPITLQLTVARLENNLLASGGGPFTSSKGVSFTIAP